MTRFAIVLLAAASTCAVYGQRGGGGPVSMTADLQRAYNGIKNNITKAAEAMPEDGYSLVPGMGERNFGGWVGHVADAQANSCGRIAGNPERLNAGAMTSKADLLAALKKSFDICDAVYEGTTEANMNSPVQSFGGMVPRISALYGNIAHDQECYGSMAVYLRVKGVVPPSSAGRGGMGRGKGRGKQK